MECLVIWIECAALWISRGIKKVCFDGEQNIEGGPAE
jgi:hypothetical protein